MKSPEFVSRSEEDIEESNRLKKGDPKSDKKGNPLKEFVSVENVSVSDIDEQEEIVDNIDSKKEENEDEKEREFFKKKELLKKEIINNIKEKEEIGFLQNDEDVAHVGPEFYKEGNESEMIPELVDEDSEGFPYRKPMKEVLKDLLGKYGLLPRRAHRNTGLEHDNLKTMTDSKKERLSRAKLREIIDNGDNFSNN